MQERSIAGHKEVIMRSEEGFVKRPFEEPNDTNYESNISANKSILNSAIEHQPIVF